MKEKEREEGERERQKQPSHKMSFCFSRAKFSKEYTKMANIHTQRLRSTLALCNRFGYCLLNKIPYSDYYS